jgi:hypothetical protein
MSSQFNNPLILTYSKSKVKMRLYVMMIMMIMIENSHYVFRTWSRT